MPKLGIPLIIELATLDTCTLTRLQATVTFMQKGSRVFSEIPLFVPKRVDIEPEVLYAVYFAFSPLFGDKGEL